MLHEVVAHKGLREVVGEENYDEFLGQVYEHAKKDVRDKINQKMGKNGWDHKKATDEYLGDLYEKGFEDFTPGERSIWQKLKELVLRAIDKFLMTLHLPKSIKLGDNELRYILWRSYQNLKRGKENVIQTAQDVVKRSELKLGEYSDAAIYRSGKDKKIMPDTGKQSKETTVATAISSITGTKVLKNLDDTSKHYENLDGTHNSRMFISDLGKSLGLHQTGSSQYGEFETVNGKRLTIRLRDAARVAVFGFIMQLAWNLGGYLPYLLLVDDDEEKDKMMDDALIQSLYGPLEGLPGGDNLSKMGLMLSTGDFKYVRMLAKEMPLTKDVANVMNRLMSENRQAEGLNELVNLAFQIGIGVNPQSISDGVVAMMDACGNDVDLANEAAIFAMRVLQVPQKQMEKVYFDENNMSAEEARKFTPQQLVKRYAEYKVKRGRFNVPWTWDDADASYWEQLGRRKVKKRIEGLGVICLNIYHKRS